MISAGRKISRYCFTNSAGLPSLLSEGPTVNIVNLSPRLHQHTLRSDNYNSIYICEDFIQQIISDL